MSPEEKAKLKFFCPTCQVTFDKSVQKGHPNTKDHKFLLELQEKEPEEYASVISEIKSSPTLRKHLVTQARQAQLQQYFQRLKE